MDKIIRVIVNIVFAVVSTVTAAVEVNVVSTGGKVTMSASYEVDAPTTVVKATLTDFQGMVRYMPGLKESKVVNSHDNVVVVNQKGSTKVGWFSSEYDSTRELTINANQVASKNVGGEDGEFSSTTTWTEVNGKTLVSYKATWYPTSSLVRNMGEGSIKSNLEKNFNAQQKEIQRRTGTLVAGM